MNPTVLGALGYTRVYARGRGTVLTDTEGRDVLDFCAATTLGHNHDALKDALRASLDEDAPNLVPLGSSIHATELAAELGRLVSPLTRCLLVSSAAEAVDGAIKLARAATRRKGILYAKRGFHGIGLGGLSLAGVGRVRDPFEPLLPSCFEVPYDDLPALEKALAADKIAAFVVEPVQVESGVIFPRSGYLRGAHALCHKHGALLVLDESHTGLGRTGSLFAFQAEGFTPDVLVVGDALGAGLFSIGATMTTPELSDRAYGRLDRFDLATFAGFGVVCRIALAGLRIVREELVPNAHDRGEHLRERLKDEIGQHPLVRAVRGRGLLVGIELGPARPKGGAGLLARFLPSVVDNVSKRLFGQWLAVRLLDRGILCRPCSYQWNVLKLVPPLNVSEGEVDRVVSATSEILGEYKELTPLLVDIGQKLGSQFLAAAKTWTT